jgi:hypothetical protein
VGEELARIPIEDLVSYEYARRTALARVLASETDPNAPLVLLLIDKKMPCAEKDTYVFGAEGVSSLKDHTGWPDFSSLFFFYHNVRFWISTACVGAAI